MTQATTQQPILVYTEATPNPETLKFVTNKMLLANLAADFPDEPSAKESPLALELFGFPFVKGVFVASNFITITKTEDSDWHGLIPSLREFIKDYVGNNKEIVTEEYIRSRKVEAAGAVGGEGVEDRIKAVLEKYVRPAVEMDGGAIIFKSYENGVVELQMQGACSGCPSSTVTLKAGIEGLLKRMVPEVEEVVAESV